MLCSHRSRLEGPSTGEIGVELSARCMGDFADKAKPYAITLASDAHMHEVAAAAGVKHSLRSITVGR